MFWLPNKRNDIRSFNEDQITASKRLRILHLGFEDFRKPGSGGGSVRTHEINRRIAEHHDVTVLAAKYRGYYDRVEDGVRYKHIGLPIGYFGSILAYFATLPFAVRRHSADLIVEDFAAPFSSCLSPLWSRHRSIAMVQWLNAREKSRQYHLPFWVVERLGLRLHTRYIAVSTGIADRIRAKNPRAHVEIVGNGVPQSALATPFGHPRKDILYVGRIEREQKGLDLLLDAFAQIADKTTAKLVLVGDGPDETWLRGRIVELGIAKRVELCGRLDGQPKHTALASAQVIAMPSRFETFGMVAVEGLAGGAPVVAFDIPCLREVIPARLGVLVPAYDVSAMAAALLATVKTPAREKLENERRAFAAQYDWGVLADKQRRVYEDAAADMFIPGARYNELSRGQTALEALFVSIARRHATQKKRATMALVGNYGNGNTGDEAILAGLYEMASPYVEVQVLARDAEAVSELHGITALDRKSAAGIKALLRCDVLAIGGGGLFGQGMPLLVRLLPVVGLILSFFGKDVVFTSIGTDPSMPKPTRFMLRLLARHAYAVTTRDPKTAAFLAVKRRPNRSSATSIVVDDPAIPLQPATAEELATDLGQPPVSNTLIISLKPTPDSIANKHSIQLAARAADWWMEHTNGTVGFLCLSANGDFGYGDTLTDKSMSLEAMRLCADDSKLRLLGPNLHPRVAKGLIASAVGVIGARLHALIFAHATNTPVFGLVFETKSRTFLKGINANYLELSETEPHELYTWLEAISGSAAARVDQS